MLVLLMFTLISCSASGDDSDSVHVHIPGTNTCLTGASANYYDEGTMKIKGTEFGDITLKGSYLIVHDKCPFCNWEK